MVEEIFWNFRVKKVVQIENFDFSNLFSEFSISAYFPSNQIFVPR